MTATQLTIEGVEQEFEQWRLKKTASRKNSRLPMGYGSTVNEALSTQQNNQALKPQRKTNAQKRLITFVSCAA